MLYEVITGKPSRVAPPTASGRMERGMTFPTRGKELQPYATARADVPVAHRAADACGRSAGTPDGTASAAQPVDRGLGARNNFV